MRKTILFGALLLASAGLAQAQDQQQQTTGAAQATPASSFKPSFGQVDFGFRADSVEGDEARYNRFRDLRDGAFLGRFAFERETVGTFFRAEANNVGYRDQRYFGEFQNIGKVKASFEWNQVPLFLSSNARTLYADAGNGRLTIDPAVRLAIQTAVGNPARDARITNSLATFGRDFEMMSRRDVGAFDFIYTLNRDVDVKFNVQNTHRTGSQVFTFGFGTSPGLNPAVEMGVPMDDRTTDVKGAIEFANARTFLSLGYNGSWFENSIPLVRFDNPLRATDIAGGASVGQAVMWPSNTSFAVNLNGSYKMPGKTRASAAISVGRWSQDETIAPPTVNTALVAPPLERATAETRADIVSMVYGLNARPVKNLWLNAKYRYYDYNNKTPHFEFGDPNERLALLPIGDWSLTSQHHVTEPSSFKRQNLDLYASFAPHDYVAFGVGYGHENGDRTFRIFESTVDNTFRVTVDSTGNDYFSIRAKYEVASRTGSHFEEHLLEEVGEQPETRHFDIANRDRTRFTTVLTVTPVAFLSLNASVGTGKDDYEDTGFGLRDNESRNWSAGFDVTPVDAVMFGVNYGYEKLTALQLSRTANPLSATDRTFLDADRNWSLDQNDTVKTLTASLDLIKALPRTDVRLSYDLSDGDATYVYNMSAAGQAKVFTNPRFPLTQLTPLKNKLSGARMDVQYFVRANVALGVVYHYEDYQVDDFATDGITQLDPKNPNAAGQPTFASTLYAGYLFRPYTAHTAWLKMSYLW